MDHDGFIEKESKRIKLIEETIQNVQSYEALLDPTITEQYCFTDEWGATGDCVMMDKRNNVFNCRYTRGVLDGEMIVARYDELIGVFTMKNGRITNERPLSELKRNRMLDLDANNEICWEGDVLEDKPFGWGEAFDAKNRLLYVGFRIGDQNVCYGTTYYPDTGTIAYLGNWCRGKRWGFGHCYDRSGTLREEGIWMNDALVKSTCVRIDDSSLRLCGLHSVIASLAIGDGCCERSAELCLRHYQHLQSLSIGRGSFAQAHTLVLQYLPALESVVVGEDTFACLENCVFESESANTPLPLGLPRFSTLRLGRGALRGNGTVSQQQSSVLPFNYKNTLLLCDLPALRDLEGAGMNFVFFGMVVFERAANRADLGVGVPAVQTVRLGDDAFQYVFRFQAVEASRLQECVLVRAQFLYLFVKDSLALPALQASLAAGVECVCVADFSGNAPELRALAKTCADELGIRVQEGVYFFMPGPQFETPAEIRAIRALGGDAVGMSTVTEALTAAHCGLPLLGISVITNLAAGMTGSAVTGEEVSIRADSICVHGDNPSAVEFVKNIRAALEAEGVTIAPIARIV